METDSAWAVRKALETMARRYPPDQFPNIRYVAKGFRRDGANYVVDVDQEKPGVGGGGYVIVRPDGSTQPQLGQ